MTEKELLYVEDAINHECNIINIVTNTINNLQNQDLKDFMEQKLNEHIAFKLELLNTLEELSNEWSIING